MADDILLDVRDLRVSFGPVRAVDGVSLAISRGPFGIALVGESGSGKTTVGRAILRLVPASAGTIAFDGQDVLGLRGPRLRAYRRAVQIVFQDADNSLDPRMRVGATIGEVLIAHGLAGRGAGRRLRWRPRWRRCCPKPRWTRPWRPGTRTSCPAGSASGSRSPARSPSHPACWSSTSRPARSTSPRRPGSSPWSGGCATSASSPTC